MAKRENSYQLQRRLDIAKERETLKKNAKINNPKTYKSRPDFTTVYYRDFLVPGKLITLQASSVGLAAIGGITDAGLLAEPPDAVVPDSVRGLNYPIVKIHWFYGDNTPVVATTAWGSRYIKYYDTHDGGQSHYSLPFSLATGTITFAAITAHFETLFNPNDGTKKSILGARGQVRLMIGRETILSL
jgi:hypothetical protein